jgi:hypothetical protein
VDAGGIWKLNEIRNALKGNNWPLSGPAPVEYLVIAGGGGGGGNFRSGGGGGAGGYRTNYTSAGPVSFPKQSGGGAAVESSFSAIPGTAYTVTVGAGGAGGLHLMLKVTPVVILFLAQSPLRVVVAEEHLAMHQAGYRW